MVRSGLSSLRVCSIVLILMVAALPWVHGDRGRDIASPNQAAGPDFTISASPPSLTIEQGSGGHLTITATVNGPSLSFRVSLQILSLPQGVNAGLIGTASDPTNLSKEFAIAASCDAVPGIYYLTAEGETFNYVPEIVHSLTIPLQIVASTTCGAAQSATTSLTGTITQACQVHIFPIEPAQALQGSAPLTVNFNIGAASDQYGFVVDWTFGDGTFQHFENGPFGLYTAHTYKDPGTYQATVTVSGFLDRSRTLTCHVDYQWTIVVSSVSSPSLEPWWITVLIISSAIAFPVLTVSIVAVARIRRPTAHPIKERTTAWGSFAAIMAGGMLLVASLWQLEITSIDEALNEIYCLPFYVSCMDWTVGRDIWYMGIFAAFALALGGSWRYAASAPSRKFSGEARAIPGRTIPPRPSGEDFDEQLYNYIVRFGGTISIEAAAKHFGVSAEQVNGSIYRLKQSGRLSAP